MFETLDLTSGPQGQLGPQGFIISSTMASPKKKPIWYPTVHEDDQKILNFLSIKSYKCWVAGGAARLWYEGRSVGSSDIDIFFANDLEFNELHSFLKTIEFSRNSLGKSIFKDEEYSDFYVSTLFESKNAITFRVEITNLNVYRVQLIKKRFFENPKDIIDAFDISVCQIATDGHHWIIGSHFIDDLKNRKLRFVNYQKDRIKRLIKYWVYGFEPDIELLEQVNTDSNLEILFQNGEDDYENSF